MIEVGSLAPEFSLPDAFGKTHSLEEYRGKWVLLYFYPKDDTPGCTAEACGLRDAFADLKERGCVVLGVSADTPESHGAFISKHQLPFTLLSDVEKKVVEAYGVWREKSMYGKKYMGIVRVSFLIDPQGKIAKIYDPVTKAEEHAGEVVRELRTKN